MSKRRTKKQQKQLEEGLKGLFLLIAGASYIYTKSFVQTGIYVVLAMGLILAFFVYQNKKRRERLKASGIEEIDAMDGIQFEHYLKELFFSKGYKAEVTKPSGDYGGDLLLLKDGKKVIVQAKRHSKDVGIKAVQEVIGAKAYYSAEEAWVVTNSYFTKAAQELADKSKVVLNDRDQLIDMIISMNPKSGSTLQRPIPKLDEPALKCSRCGSPLVLRTGKRGSFYGCSNFPKCRYTKNVG